MEFPTKNYASSSAAYRAIRQFEEKHGSSNLTMTKIDKGNYEVKQTSEMTFDKFMENKPNVCYEKTTFRYFPDGVQGEGYYELKTGERRRPNSQFKTTKMVYSDYMKKRCL